MTVGHAISRDGTPIEREFEDIDALIALELFMRLAGSPDDQIQGAKDSPLWPGLEAIAHTLAYDAACLRDGRPDPSRLATIQQPTLVATGSSGGFFERGADAIAASVLRAERRTLQGQPHVPDPKVLAPVLEGFFSA